MVNKSKPSQLLSEDEMTRMLMKAPFFSSKKSVEIARFIKYVSFEHFEDGENIYKTGQSADTLYLVLNGDVNITASSGETRTTNRSFIGEESALSIPVYRESADAATAVQCVAIPRNAITFIPTECVSGAKCYYPNFVSRHFKIEPDKPIDESASGMKKIYISGYTEVLGWILVLLFPCIILLAGNRIGLDFNSRQFLAAFSMTVIMWVFNLVPHFIAGIFALLSILILDAVPPEIILSGFSSGSFFMALSIFSLGSVLVRSGITYRFVLVVLKICPPHPIFYNLIIMITGLTLTPVVPSATARINLLTPMLKDMITSLDYRKKGQSSTWITCSMFGGASLFTAIFMTSKSVNFIVLGMLPLQVQEQFQWLQWLKAASVTGLFILVSYIVISICLFRKTEKKRISRKEIDSQLKILGPMNMLEWIAVVGLLCFMVAVVTTSIHKIKPAWIALSLFLVFLSVGVFKNKHIKSEIDWPFLFLLGAMIGLVNGMKFLELDTMLGNQLTWIGYYMRTDFNLFILIMTITIFLVRLFIPISATGILVATIFIPLATLSGVNPWIVAFIILILSECWLLPHQCSYYLFFEDLSRNDELHDKTMFMRMNTLSFAIRIIAIYVSIPYWKYLGIL